MGFSILAMSSRAREIADIAWEIQVKMKQGILQRVTLNLMSEYESCVVVI